MGYFDALTSGSFKTTPDGHRLFFPWGAWGRGYLIPTEQDYERLRGMVKTYTMVSLVVVIGAVVVFGGLWAFLAAAALILFYLAWLPSLRRGLTPTDQRMTVSESMATQARTHSAWMLWLFLAMSLLFVVIGVVMWLSEPQNWLIALNIIVVFGAVAVVFIRMLVLRRR